MNNKIIRPCINCGLDDSKPMFAYTYDFMVRVHKVPPFHMKEVGWTEDTTSTIVKCNKCGCNYVRDVFPDWERGRKVASYDKIEQNAYTYKRFAGYDEENWNVRNLILFAVQEHKKDIKFLDFGAGAGSASNMARAFGVKCVVAYDPHGAFGQDEYRHFNCPGIIFTRDKEDLHKLAPFDAVICKSVVEHMFDPLGELKTIYNLMSRGGYLYINNPLMDLDREIKALLRAKTIKKSDRISHYHPAHVNYLNPMYFSRLLRSTGFEITPMVFYPPVPLKVNLTDNSYLRKTAKFLLMRILSGLKLSYKRYIFIARKP